MIDLSPLPAAARVQRLRGEIESLSALNDARRDCGASDLAAVCAVFDAWSRPASRWRAELEERVPKASGFSPEVVAAGLRPALEAWTGDAFRRMFKAELAVWREESPRPYRPFELTSVLLAGAIPMPTITALLFPLALGSPVVARPASRDPVTAELVARSLEAAAPEIAGRLRVISFPSDDEACMRLFCASSCVVASGSDATLAQVAARMTPPQHFLGYGHRLSIVLLGDEAGVGTCDRELAEPLARDICAWDQQGCLSPLAAYVVGPDAAARATRFGGVLAEVLAQQNNALPRGETSIATTAAIRQAREDVTFRVAARGNAKLYASDDTHWSVAVEEDATWRAAPLGRFIRVHPVSGSANRAAVTELVAALEPIRAHLSTVALGAFSPGLSARVSTALAGLGRFRLCRVGEMQTPPLDWEHDGLPPLRPLMRGSHLGRSQETF